MGKFRVIAIALIGLLVGLFLGSKGFSSMSKSTPPKILPKVAIAGESIPFNDVFVKVAKKVKPAVVRVETESVVTVESPFQDFFSDPFFKWFFGEPQPRTPQKKTIRGLGSGFIISPDGYIVTNNHVIEDAKNVKVKLTDGREFKAKIIGADKKSDLALLKIDAKNLSYLTWGDSSKIEVGEWVLAIGNPLGFDYTVTAGIISAKGRQLPLSEYEDFIQTDAAINRGNSGGPLVDLKGRVVGVNAVIVSTSGAFMGLGFAIPSNIAKKVITDLKLKGKVVRAYLGVTIQAITEDLAKSLGLKSTKGVIVSDIAKGSPAAKAGLKRYDVITGIDNKEVKNPVDLKITIMNHSPEDEVVLHIIRKGKPIDIKVKLGSEEQAPNYAAAQSLLGVEVAPLTGELKKIYPYGVAITRVYKGSPAYNAGLAEGDVILEINQKPVRSVLEFNHIVSKFKKGDIILLTIGRGGQAFLVTIRLGE